MQNFANFLAVLTIMAEGVFFFGTSTGMPNFIQRFKTLKFPASQNKNHLKEVFAEKLMSLPTSVPEIKVAVPNRMNF